MALAWENNVPILLGMRWRSVLEGVEVIPRIKSFPDLSVIYPYLVGLVLISGCIGWYSVNESLNQYVARSPKAPSVAAPRHKDLLLMDAVREVSADTSMLLLSSVAGRTMDEPAACLLAADVIGRKDFPASALKKWNSECTLGKMVRQATDPVFQAIVQSRALPSVAVTFDAYVGFEEKWQTLGLFADFDTCERVRAAAGSLGIGIRSCLPWVPRF